MNRIYLNFIRHKLTHILQVEFAQIMMFYTSLVAIIHTINHISTQHTHAHTVFVFSECQ